ncbi:MAG TPA: cyclic nucleotide-binding domain-containing protein [Actinomycetes bacterium]|nr:cyclic nucleotide-binding domain-containing protein [Actinomycetes bacterium]
MRMESSVVSVSWIPWGAVEGMVKVPFEMGVAHYDMPPPDRLTDLQALLASSAVRFANELRAWVEMDGGKVTGCGHVGKGHMGSTSMRVAGLGVTFPGVSFPDLRGEPEVREDAVRFTQTVGGRAGMPAPRRVRRRPFAQLAAPTVWSTLALTIYADGSSDFEVVGASPFPRHWIYDHDGRLAAKTGFIDFETWYRESFGDKSPWGDEESPVIVTAVESALERELSRLIIGSDPPFRRLSPGEALVEQGEPGEELFLLFDGILSLEQDGRPVVEIGPGAILGEMALLEGGRRTATLRAVTPCRVAVVHGDRVNREMLTELARRRRGDAP